MKHTLPHAVEPRNILVLQQRQIGDVLLATPLLELLKRRWPLARITLFTESKCVPLLEGNPHVSEFLALDKNRLRSLTAQLSWYRRAAAQGFDLVVDCQQLPRCRMLTLFCALNGADLRLSFPSVWSKLGLYNLAAAPEPGVYAAATKASLLAPLDIVWSGEKPRIYLTEKERNQAADLLRSLGASDGMRLITVDATHRRASKRWPAVRWAQVLDLLAESDPSLRFLLLRGPGEDNEVRALKSLCACADSILIPDPAPSLRLSAACMARAVLHMGHCSAPRHMAVALDVPSIVIPGASGPEWKYHSRDHVEFRPELTCSPCDRVECADPQCLLRVLPEEVAAKAKELVSKTSGRNSCR